MAIASNKAERKAFDLSQVLAGRSPTARTPQGIHTRSIGGVLCKPGGPLDMVLREAASRPDGLITVEEVMALTGSARSGHQTTLHRVLKRGLLRRVLYKSPSSATEDHVCGRARRPIQIYGYQIAPEYLQAAGGQDARLLDATVIAIDAQRDQMLVEGACYIGGATVLSLGQARRIAAAIAAHDAQHPQGTPAQP